MPKPKMTEKNLKAYVNADNMLRRIEACRREGKAGTVLTLANLGLTSLPYGIGQLTALRQLSLEGNQLTRLSQEIGQLTALTELNLSHNRLTSLPPEIGQLTALTWLNLKNNQLTRLPPDIEQLTALTLLSLSGNQLANLPPEIGQLTALTELYISNNQLTSLPAEIGQLTVLTKLYLSNNRLTNLPPEIGRLKTLSLLYLHGNRGLGLPIEILGPPSDDDIYLGKAKAKPPREILEYYFATRGKEGRALREIKLILVGRGEVGKSSMADALQEKEFVKHRQRTDGIAITPWEVKLPDGPAEVLIWDFGGQEIMHGTHQFFLTHRSLYVVMVDGRHDRQKQDAEYWLKLVQAFGGNSTVLVVMNRQQAHPFDMDRQYLADKYGVKLEHFFRTDCAVPKDIKQVRETILDEVSRMLATEERFPAKCWDVKARLENMKTHGEDYLSDEAYADICTKHGVENPEEQQKLLRRLADLGTVVSFPDEVKLSELTVLNPEWATDGIYRVVTNEELREQRHGQLQLAALRKLLPTDRWQKPKHVRYMLDLMEKFELCFPVGDSPDIVLVPELLPDKTPPLPDWDPAQCVVFLYQYTVLPHGVLPRFITRSHTLGGGERWRSGAVLTDDGAEALIKADYDTNRMSVWIRGPHADARRALLKVVRHHFDHIHARIKGLNPEEQVAVPGHPNVTLPYRDLIMDERDGKTAVRVTINGQRVDKAVSELLNGVESLGERKKTQARLDLERGGRSIHVESGGHYHEHKETMSDDHSIHIGGHVTNAQVGQTLTNCTNLIQRQAPGDRRELLEDLEKQVQQLLIGLAAERQDEAPHVVENLEMLVKQATSAKPNRKWYSVSADGLLEASKFAKDLGGNMAGTMKNLGKSLWPDFHLPEPK